MPETKLSTARMEAFSDGVIAVIITIMVLELKVPEHSISNLEGLRELAPMLLIYLLSFVQVGIYWVNHHYLVADAEEATHGILWANLIFLFFLSLFPLATRWVGERGISSFSIGLYSLVSFLTPISWTFMSYLICRRSRGRELNISRTKEFVSLALYLCAIASSFYSPWLALALLGIVALLWLIPPKKVIESTRASLRNSPTQQ